MLHYGMQHAAVHEPVNGGGGGQDGSLSQLDAPDEHDYAHWLQLSSPQTPVQPQVQGDQQSFVQDAYSAQQAAYYSSQQAQQPPATPVQVDQVYDAQSQFGYYLYDEQHQVQPPQQPQEPNGGAQYAYYNDAGDEHEQPEQQQHILDSPPSSAYPSQDAYTLFATQFSTPEPQIQMAMYSSSPIERQPQQVPPPQPPSRLHPRVYPPSSNPLRPSRLRQVSNYEDDIQDMPAVSDQAAVSFDDRLAATVLVPQPSESLAFALASPIKMSTDSSSTSPVQARADPGPFNDTTGPDNMSLLHSQSQSDSLYAALFSSADVAPIVTTRDEVPVDVEPSWTAESELLGAPAVHSAPALPTFSVDSALAGAVMDEFEFREVDVPQVVLVNADDTDADADADAEGETDSGSPLPPLDLSGSNSASSNALTSSTLADEDWFTSPQAEHLKLVEQPKQEDELAMMLGDVLVESVLETPAAPSDAVASDQVAALTAALSSFLDSAAAASAGDTLSTTPPPSVVRPDDELDPAAALLALAGPAPRTPQNTVPPSAPSSVSVPLITVVAPKRGGAGGKRKRGSATSSPARSRLSSPMPSPLSTPTHPRRRFFPQSPIAFHLGPTDDSDPRHRMRHGTRGNKLVGIDAEHQLEDKDKDHDLFVIRGGVFDHVPNGARIKVAAQRTGSRTRGSENAGLRSATTSRAGSATGTSPAPGNSKPNTRAKKAKTRETSEAVFTPPVAAAPLPAVSERPRRESTKRAQPPPPPEPKAKPLFTSVPRPLPPASATPAPPPPPTLPQNDMPAQFVYEGVVYHVMDPSLVAQIPTGHYTAMSWPVPQSLPQPAPQPTPQPIASRRAPPRRQSVPKLPKVATSQKRKRGGDDDDSLDELEDINHDGGYDDDYSAPRGLRVAGSSSLKRPRRNTNVVAAPAAMPAVPPRSSAALPPVSPAGMPYPGTPSAESFPSPLTPLTDLPSSSPPVPAAAPSPSPMGPPRLQVSLSRPQTPGPAFHVPVSPVSTLTPSPHVQTPLPQERVKRGPRRAPAMPAFSNSGTVRMESPVASSSAMTLEGTASAGSLDFSVIRPSVSTALPSYRTFRQDMEVKSTEFPLWYRRYPVIAVFRPFDALGDAVLGTAERPKFPNGATFNNPTTVYDLYTPRYVKGTGREKQGMCPVCAEPPERGGEGKQYWFAMKVSAYNYHMQNAHGISASSKLPFSPPFEFRNAKRAVTGKHEKGAVLEGKCHQCQKFIPLEGVKVGDIKVKEIYWWKHASKCHQSSVEGECDLYYEDTVLSRIQAFEARERVATMRSASRNPGTYPVPAAFLVMPNNVAGPSGSQAAVHQSPIMQMSGHNLPMNVHPNQMAYGQVAAAYQVQMPVAGPSHHGSPIDTMSMSPTQASFLRIQTAPAAIAIPQLPSQLSPVSSAASTYAAAVAAYQAHQQDANAAADAAAAYVAGTGGLQLPPEMHMQ